MTNKVAKKSELIALKTIASGEKYLTSSGIRAVKDGIRPNEHRASLIEKPDWLRVRHTSSPEYHEVVKAVRTNDLATVCEEAKCPNIGECWGAGTATIMLMGDVCTRACKFCAVNTGNPLGWLDTEEPIKTANAVKLMNLKYVVLTSVNRDDLNDGGASHYASCVREIKLLDPAIGVEALTPDFLGVADDVYRIMDAGVDVFAQNLETVERLTHPVRDSRAGYYQTLDILKLAKARNPKVLTKTSLMLGLGESDEEILATMQDIYDARVDILTLGQYLQPTKYHYPIERYVSPEEFLQYREWGLDKGFREVVSGALVRSSYRAERALQKNNVDL